MPLLLKYLEYAPPAGSKAPGEDDDDEEEAGDLEKVKAEICEIAQLYSLRYLDAFGEGGYLGPFVEKTWGLLTKLGGGVKYDIVRRPRFVVSRLDADTDSVAFRFHQLVAKATGFLAVVVKMPSQRALFQDPNTLRQFCENIVLPSMTLRTFEEEMFEDDAPEYVRRDLDSVSESGLRLNPDVRTVLTRTLSPSQTAKRVVSPLPTSPRLSWSSSRVP